MNKLINYRLEARRSTGILLLSVNCLCREHCNMDMDVNFTKHDTNAIEIFQKSYHSNSYVHGR